MDGWKRLGIVISIVWILGAGFYTLKITTDRSVELGNRLADECNGDRAGMDDKCMEIGLALSISRIPGDRIEAVFVAFGPVLFAWIIGYPIFRWIRRGFASGPADASRNGLICPTVTAVSEEDKQVEKDKLKSMDIHEFVEYCCQELSKIPQEERLMTAYSALAARDNLASWEQEELERLQEILQQRQQQRPLEEQRQFEERLEESRLRAKIILQRHQQQRQ